MASWPWWSLWPCAKSKADLPLVDSNQSFGFCTQGKRDPPHALGKNSPTNQTMKRHIQEVNASLWKVHSQGPSASFEIACHQIREWESCASCDHVPCKWRRRENLLGEPSLLVKQRPKRLRQDSFRVTWFRAKLCLCWGQNVELCVSSKRSSLLCFAERTSRSIFAQCGGYGCEAVAVAASLRLSLFLLLLALRLPCLLACWPSPRTCKAVSAACSCYKGGEGYTYLLSYSARFALQTTHKKWSAKVQPLRPTRTRE